MGSTLMCEHGIHEDLRCADCEKPAASVERGPEPASPLPWEVRDEGVWGMRSVYDADCHEVCDASHPTAPDAEGASDAAAIVHRVNNGDALHDERDELRAEVERLRELGRAASDEYEHIVSSSKLQRSDELFPAFVKHMVESDDWEMETVLYCLEKPWKWTEEFISFVRGFTPR